MPLIQELHPVSLVCGGQLMIELNKYKSVG